MSEHRGSSVNPAHPSGNGAKRPWYERTLRWGQTNLTEIDPQRWDPDFWRNQWERTAVQGIIVNAGGIVAYYPTEVPLHSKSPHLGDQDLFGQINADARAAGLTVLARMDCNRADDAFYEAHPDWFCVDTEGKPYMAAGRYLACINGPYYSEFIPQVLTEIAQRYQPDGFADNSWSGMGRSNICQCTNCHERFTADTGHTLPTEHDWDDPAYAQWIDWSYQRRLDIWDLFDATAREAGGPDCRWIGMNSGQLSHQSNQFRDLAGVIKRTPLALIDNQFRDEKTGFSQNNHTGKLVLGMPGAPARAAESMAMYNHSSSSFRVASKPSAEARMWGFAGMAGGILPWWHHIGATHADQRQYDTAPPMFTWHAANDQYLVDRSSLATIGVLWSQRSNDFYGRDDAHVRSGDPYQGVIHALTRAGLDHRAIHPSALAQGLEGIDVLVLPAVGAMSDAECAAIRAFVKGGGGLVATGESSLYDHWGARRDDFALADLFGASATGQHHGHRVPPKVSWETAPTHTYLQLLQSWKDDGERHQVLDGFDRTDQLPFGGRVEEVTPTSAKVLATWVAPFAAYPPETSWQREPATDIPTVLVNEFGGRVVYLPADIDRCFGRGYQPDHADLLTNAVRWAAKNPIPVDLNGALGIDVSAYSQKPSGSGEADRVIVHLVNLTGAGAWKMPASFDTPTPQVTVTLDLTALGGAVNAQALARGTARLLVAGSEVELRVDGTKVEVTIPTVVDHEVLVVQGA